MGKTSFPLWLRPSKRGLVGRTQESKEGRIPMPPLPFYTLTTRTVPITVHSAPATTWGVIASTSLRKIAAKRAEKTILVLTRGSTMTSLPKLRA